MNKLTRGIVFTFLLGSLVYSTQGACVNPPTENGIHTPTITPADKKTGDLPPRLEAKPLPPM